MAGLSGAAMSDTITPRKVSWTYALAEQDSSFSASICTETFDWTSGLELEIYSFHGSAVFWKLRYGQDFVLVES